MINDMITSIQENLQVRSWSWLGAVVFSISAQRSIYPVFSCRIYALLRVNELSYYDTQCRVQAEATKKQYCDAEMGKAKDKKARKQEL